jgi:hypothetical protein
MQSGDEFPGGVLELHFAASLPWFSIFYAIIGAKPMPDNPLIRQLKQCVLILPIGRVESALGRADDLWVG